MNGHSTRSIPSLSPPPSDSNPTQQFDPNASDFWNNDDVMMSTQRFEEETNTLPRNTYPHIRSTAKKMGTWQMQRSEQPVPDTSMVNKEFQDFDHSISDEEDISLEQARGGHRSNRSTPGKVNSSFGAFNSLYDMTPPSTRTRKSGGGDIGNLRKDAQIRRASRNDMVDAASPRPTSLRNSPAVANRDRKRTSLAQSHAKISEDESSLLDERPPTLTFQAKSTRWGAPRSRQGSFQMDGATGTRAKETARSRPATAQGTAQSFMLPDIPNITELVSGVFQDGTPLFSKSTPARNRFSAPNRGGRKNKEPTHIPVDSVPIPEEEKAIFASLQLLQEKVSQLEQELAEAEKKIEEQEVEIIELKSRPARNTSRGSDAGDLTDTGKNAWKIEKTRKLRSHKRVQHMLTVNLGLEASVQTLQKKLEHSERKLSVSNIEKNRLQKERDNMATQLTVAFQNFDELKGEKEALSAENETLRQEIDQLRSENESLREQLEHEQQQYREETLQLRRQAERTGSGTNREVETLRAELSRVRARNDENTQQLQRKEAELRKARKEQSEFAKLKTDNDFLKEQLAAIKAKREQDMRRWLSRENELKGRVERRDETIRHFQDMTQEQTNEAMRLDNENLRRELAQLTAQHDEEASRWLRKEEKLKRKIDAAEEKEGLTREILNVRQANDQRYTSASGNKENDFQQTGYSTLQRRPSNRREDTRTRIANRVQQEVRNNKPSHSERSPQKSYSKISRSRPSLPVNPSRTVSAPVTGKKYVEVDSDVESTTDLSLAPRGTPYTMRGGATGMTSGLTVEPPAPLDLTELSYIDADQIAQLRRALEEERAALRAKASGTEARQTREDTVRSAVSTKSTRQQSLPRKSSMKDITERTGGTVFEDLTGRVSNVDPTQTGRSEMDNSIVSNTSRRRRSAPAENMTSAFIVPDITMHARKNSTSNIKLDEKTARAHDNDNCTVCRRENNNTNHNAAAEAEPVQIPKLVPVSQRMPDDADATIRPSQSPADALALVVKELKDERAHLHLELAACRAMLEAHDVSLGMKKRGRINEVMLEILRLIEVKDTQIYHLYDVLEGQAAGGGEGGEGLTEAEVEELTREIRVQDGQAQQAAPEARKKGKGKGKKVTVRSFHESDREDEEVVVSDDADEDEEEDLPWEGFEDTGSINFRGFDAVGGRRGSVFA